jgi:hypothetical protein
VQSYNLKNINYERLSISFMILAAIATASYAINYANQESGYEQGIIIKILKWLYLVIAFPNVILHLLKIHQSWWVFWFSVATGALFYSLLIEFVLKNRGNIKSKNKSEIEHPDSEI